MGMETEIREFILSLGVDDVGFARAVDYHSPKSYEITTFLPDAKTIIVLAFQALSSCESPNLSTALNGMIDLAAFSRASSYRVARLLESKYHAKVANIPISYPFEIDKTKQAIGDFSQRHAAVAAGLGSFDRHNLVMHPEFGTRVNFVSIITNLALQPSVQCKEDFCIHCNLCVENCPSRALDDEGKTDIRKCVAHSLPYGLGADIAFQTQFIDSSPEEQKKMLLSEQYARLGQSAHLGNQYRCFNCMKTCPVGV
jgi:epoxyqueuosine reductase QueG